MDVGCGYWKVGEGPMSSEARIYKRGGGRLCLLVVVVVHGCFPSHVHRPCEIARLSMRARAVPHGHFLLELYSSIEIPGSFLSESAKPCRANRGHDIFSPIFPARATRA